VHQLKCNKISKLPPIFRSHIFFKFSILNNLKNYRCIDWSFWIFYKNFKDNKIIHLKIWSFKSQIVLTCPSSTH
jgi:hypothetical protein